MFYRFVKPLSPLTPQFIKMLLQIYWKKSQSEHVALSFPSDTVAVYGEEKIKRDAYDAKYANGLVFTHYRTEDVIDEKTGQTYQNNFVGLRIGVKTLGSV